MTRVRLEYGAATTRMKQLYVGRITVKREMYVMSSTKMEKGENDDSKSWMR